MNVENEGGIKRD